MTTAIEVSLQQRLVEEPGFPWQCLGGENATWDRWHRAGKDRLHALFLAVTLRELRAWQGHTGLPVMTEGGGRVLRRGVGLSLEVV